jgi:indolepyruvate ferredoxin oxidoreductase
LLIGYAWQKGRIPLSRSAVLKAMELNGTQVANNQAAFEWGRRCAHDLASVRSLYAAQQVIQIVKRPSLDEVIGKRVEFLTGYQNAAYADEYRAFVAKVRTAEMPLSSTKLTEAVARYLFKLMAYKDEYEVARLHSDPAFAAQIGAMFEGDFKLVHHLAPPLLGKTDAQGNAVKQAFGPWMHKAMPWLAKLKGLRGTAFDPFGRTEERRTERALVGEYRAAIEEVLGRLSAERLGAAVEIARVPEEIRGYGRVKAGNLAKVRAKWARLMVAWRA